MSKQISFCISCRNRLWQIQQTLADNLSALESDMEIVLVDYGSTDGLSEWVWQNFDGDIRAGKLTFFQVTNPVTWSSPKAKNLAHRLGQGSYLFNADADNFFTPTDCRLILDAARTGLPSHQWSGNYGDGSFGRIGLPKAMFLDLGGYDENLLPMGSQDKDLLTRLGVLDDRFFKLPPPLKPAIPNTPEEKMKELGTLSELSDPKLAYYFTNQTNNTLAYLKLQIEGPRRIGGFASFQGLLNGVTVVIDGFNNITRTAPHFSSDT
jgi:glycosyltransferase involved in cell wall biosynthesis